MTGHQRHHGAVGLRGVALLPGADTCLSRNEIRGAHPRYTCVLLFLKNGGATLFRATPPPPGTPYSSGILFKHYPQSKLVDLPRIVTP